jgi:hypothetical protein
MKWLNEEIDTIDQKHCLHAGRLSWYYISRSKIAISLSSLSLRTRFQTRIFANSNICPILGNDRQNWFEFNHFMVDCWQPWKWGISVVLSSSQTAAWGQLGSYSHVGPHSCCSVHKQTGTFTRAKCWWGVLKEQTTSQRVNESIGLGDVLPRPD